MRHGRFNLAKSAIRWALAATAALGGCASTARYSVVAPAMARGEVTRNAGQIVTRDRVDYELFQFEDRLVLRFVNRGGVPLSLTEQSVMIDAAGRSFGVEPQELAPDASARVVIPPTAAAERTRPTAAASEVRVGGVDEGGLIGTRRDVETNASGLNAGAAAAPPPGFRFRAGQVARVRLVFRPTLATTTPAGATTVPTTLPTAGDDGLITHEWTLRREN